MSIKSGSFQFLALDFPLERMKRKTYSYTVEDASKEHFAFLRKAYIHNVIIDEQFYDEVKEKFDKSKESKYTYDAPIKKELEVVFETVSEEVNIKELDDLELSRYLIMLEKKMNVPENDNEVDTHFLIKRYHNTLLEQKSRLVINQQEFPF